MEGLNKIERDRVFALQRAFLLTRLLDERYYPDVYKAVNSKDQKLFFASCKKADISEEIAENLWKLLLQEGITYADLWCIPMHKLPPKGRDEPRL